MLPGDEDVASGSSLELLESLGSTIDVGVVARVLNGDAQIVGEGKGGVVGTLAAGICGLELVIMVH